MYKICPNEIQASSPRLGRTRPLPQSSIRMMLLPLLLLLAPSLLLLVAAPSHEAPPPPPGTVCPHGGCPGSGRTCPPRYNQCPALGVDGTAVGPKTNAATCDPGSPGCKQGMQCQDRETNPFMPIFHIMGNFTDGDGTQPVSVNDVSAIIQWKGVWHGMCPLA
jgi:hypothetical protein